MYNLESKLFEIKIVFTCVIQYLGFWQNCFLFGIKTEVKRRRDFSTVRIVLDEDSSLCCVAR